MACIFVTGTEGFISRHLLPCPQGVLHGLTLNDTRPIPNLNAHRTAGRRDADNIDVIISTVPPTYIIQLAGTALVACSDAGIRCQTDILGTRSFQQAISRLSNPLQSVLNASSANIYGNWRHGTLTEVLPSVPANDFGNIKVAAENLAEVHMDRRPITATRSSIYTKLGQAERLVAPEIVPHVRTDSPVVKLGNIDAAGNFSEVCAYEVCSLYCSRVRLESGIGPLDMPPLEVTLSWMLHG